MPIKAKLFYFVPVMIAAPAIIYKSAYGEDFFWSNSGYFLTLTKDDFSNLKGIETKNIDGSTPRTKKIIDVETGKKIINNIRDYSVKVKTECGSGTGWFLDYEIPQEGKYPLKWFVATNAHVINRQYFNNPITYGQNVPVSRSELYRWQTYGLSGWIPCVSEKLSLIKSENEQALEDPRWWTSNWAKYYFNKEGIWAKNAKHDEDRWNKLSHIPIIYSEIKNPKLFYVPINFLGKKTTKFAGLEVYSERYYKDFAVIEINFESEREARRITNNLYEKNENERLDFFKSELIRNNSGDELAKSGENYFAAGYPGNSYNEFKSFGNYSSSKKTASGLTHWVDSFSLKNKYKQPIIGHANTKLIDSTKKDMRLLWNGRKYFNWGYNYVLDDMPMGPGASGSLVIDSNKNVLGLYRAQDSSNNIGFVEPLRSEGLMVNSEIIIPKYDLIKGAKGQIGSYREQLEKIYPRLKTYLQTKWNIRGVDGGLGII